MMIVSSTLAQPDPFKYSKVDVDEDVYFSNLVKNFFTCGSYQKQLDRQFKASIISGNISGAIKARKKGSISHLNTDEVIELMTDLQEDKRLDTLLFLFAQIRNFNQIRYETVQGTGPWDYVDPAAKGISRAYLILKKQKDPGAELIHRIYNSYRDDQHKGPLELGVVPEAGPPSRL